MRRHLFKIISTCKGGGYMYARTVPLHPRANAKGLYPLHRVRMENKLGRLLGADEIVHHVDRNKDNNATTNLMVMGRASHSAQHAIEDAPHPVILECRGCRKPVNMKPGDHRRRMKASGGAGVFCSRSCSASHYMKLRKKRVCETL